MTQFSFQLKPYSRGFHIITDEILNQISGFPETGLMHVYIQHTSAGICINENADPSVLHDLNCWFDENIKEEEPYFQHTFEGPDDMPAHIKSIVTGNSITIPIKNRKPALGIWQGIYLGEFRNRAQGRNLIVTLQSG